MAITDPVRNKILSDFARAAGRHEDPAVYSGPPGDPGLTGPGSVSWRLHGDLASVALAGIPAILLELLHPSVIAGVQDHSAYRDDPFHRARATLGYVLVTTFGNTEAAEGTIERVRRVHSRIHGRRPDGVAYRASDPELLAWVHTAIPWMIMRAYERYHRPLSPEDRDRYLTEQAVIGRMGGADWVPETVRELDAYLEDMRPKLEVNDQTRDFIDFLLSAPSIAELPVAAADRALQAGIVRAGMSLAPRWAREMTGFDLPAVVRRAVVDPYLHADARMLRWAFRTPPYLALARERAGAARRSERSPVAVGAAG